MARHRMTGFGQGLLAGLQGAAQYNRGVQQSQNNALVQEEQLRKFEQEDNAALVSQLSNKGLLNLEASNKDQILNTDVETLFRDNKEVALQLANRLKVLNQAEKEDGGKVGTKAVDYLINEDGTYSFIMEREDNGKRVPLTQGRTELGDDIVAKFSAEDLSRVVNTQMVDVLEKGGFGSKFGFMATTAALHPHELRAEIQRKAAEDAAASTQPGAQEMASQMSFLVTQTDDVDTLEKYATDLGLDVDAIRAKADADAKANADAAGNTTSPDDTQPDATTTQTTTDLTAVASANKSLQGLRKLMEPKSKRGIGRENAELIDTAKKDLDNALEALPEIQKLREQQNALPNNRKGQTEKAQISAQIRKEKERLIELSQEDNLEAKKEPAPIIPPLSAEQLRTSIMEVTNNPEFVTRTRQVLQNAGVTSLSQLRDAVEQNRVPTKEANDAIIAAAVFAANQPGATESAATMVQRFRNQVLRSSQTYDLEEAIDDDRADLTLAANIDAAQTTKARLRMDTQKWIRTLRQDGDIPENILNDQDAIFDEFNNILENDIDIADSTGLAKTFTRMRTRLMGLKGSPNYEAAKKVLPGLYARYMLEVGRNEGAADVPDWFRDIFRGDADKGIIANLAPNLVTNSDRTKIGIRDPDGSDVVYESPVATGRLRQLMGIDIHKDLISQLPIKQF